MDKMIVTAGRYLTDLEGNNITVSATIDGQEMSVPMDPTNRHYQAILEWVADGNTIEAAE